MCLLSCIAPRHKHTATRIQSVHALRAGNKVEELPEQLLCATRMHRVDFTRSRPLPLNPLHHSSMAAISVAPAPDVASSLRRSPSGEVPASPRLASCAKQRRSDPGLDSGHLLADVEAVGRPPLGPGVLDNDGG
jgi:hypothetical protein